MFKLAITMARERPANSILGIVGDAFLVVIEGGNAARLFQPDQPLFNRAIVASFFQ